VDPRTVDFILKAADPLFVTEYLAVFRILSRNAVEADYASFLASTKGLASTDLTKLADAIDEEVAADPPVCTRRLDAVSALLERLEVRLYREDFASGTAGTFDPCAWMRTASFFIRQAATALGSTGLDAVAAAFTCFSTSWHPVGTGPYRLASEAVDRVHLEAWPGYHGGVAATRYLDFVPARADGSDVVDGTVDILQTAVSPTLPAGARPQTVRVVARPGTQFNALVFNVRAGHAFADVNLRKALQLCIDLPRDVDVVSRGDGTPVYGPVPPGTWAFDEALPGPARDAAAARALIEGAGWRLGADGIYAKDGVRLAARIVARGEFDYRVKMADLIGLQARDCGMDLRTIAATWDDIMTMVSTYPHVIPGTNTPFDLYIGGFSSDVDPAPVIGMLVSSAITDAAHPDGANFGGFTDPALDRLVAAAGSTYDQAERARLYRQAQEELASQLPWLWLWAVNDFRVARTAVASVDGPVDLTAINWSWQPERLVVAKGAQ
jgi:ABC-type transport system substrate-binding protein